MPLKTKFFPVEYILIILFAKLTLALDKFTQRNKTDPAIKKNDVKIPQEDDSPFSWLLGCGGGEVTGLDLS
jgi:hypothetical protein